MHLRKQNRRVTSCCIWLSLNICTGYLWVLDHRREGLCVSHRCMWLASWMYQWAVHHIKCCWQLMLCILSSPLSQMLSCL